MWLKTTMKEIFKQKIVKYFKLNLKRQFFNSVSLKPIIIFIIIITTDL